MEDEFEIERIKIGDIDWSEDISPVALLDLDFCYLTF